MNKGLQIKKYTVRPCLFEEMDKGYIWLSDHCAKNSIVQIMCQKTGKRTICEIRTIDDNYINKFNAHKEHNTIDSNKRFAIMSEWYRKKLGVQKNEEYTLITSKTNFSTLKSGFHHPQAIARAATYSSIIGFALGILSILIGFLKGGQLIIAFAMSIYLIILNMLD